MKKIILIALLTTICPAGYSHDIVKGADGREYLNYEVQRGDYLAKISLVTGVKVADIKAVNGEDVETLKIGQVIRIPMPEGYAARAAKAKEMVVRGEVYIELLADKEGSSLNFLRARTALMVASILDPLSADAWHKLGFLYANAYDSEYAYYALANYRKAIALRPKAIDVCLEAGVCATQLNKLQLGKVFYSLALAIDPCNEAAMKGITKAYYDQGKVKEAQVYNAYQIEFGGLDLVPVGSDRR